jgi:hypothetical protein
MEKKFKRTTVTSALPYANGPVHIGRPGGAFSCLVQAADLGAID